MGIRSYVERRGSNHAKIEFDERAENLPIKRTVKHMKSNINIRILGVDDGADVCRIWVNGLNQSRLAVR